MSVCTITTHRLILVGFGTVAQGLLDILRKKGPEFRRDYGADFKIVAVCTGTRGHMVDPTGLDLDQLWELSQNRAPFQDHLFQGDVFQVLERVEAETVVEISPTQLRNGQPAIAHCDAAFQSGKHVVCGNKGPAALDYERLQSLADDHERYFLHEATVLSGTPVFSFADSALAGNQILGVEGILNGSTNFILDALEAGETMDQALATAQTRGYLEADPRGDIDGHDAQAKLAVLARVLMDLPLDLEDIHREGIGHMTNEEVHAELGVTGFESVECESPPRKDVGTTFDCTGIDDQGRTWEFEGEIIEGDQYVITVSRFP